MRVNEIFYSLQGEGFYTGTPAVFVRFSGCNLKCPFCDTDFSEYEEMTEEEVVEAVKKIAGDCRFVVLTGGEPTLQITKSFISLLHHNWFSVAMETNGTREWPDNIDWVTVSPKSPFCGEKAALRETNPVASEVKVVFNGENTAQIEAYSGVGEYRYIQPCDTGNTERNAEILALAIEWLKEHPEWRLSLQTQKIIKVR